MQYNWTKIKINLAILLAISLFPVISEAGGFNGSGTYNRYFNWTNDANASIPITASRFDTEDNGFATGLSQCITKDGQQTVTANIPFAGFKLLNIGDATLAKDAVNAETLQDGGLIWAGTATGTNTIAIGVSPAIGSYTAGQMFSFIAANSNTGAVTVNVNGVGAEALDKPSPSGIVALAANDIIAGQSYTIIFDGTEFQLVTPASLTASTVSPAFTGTPTAPTAAVTVNNTQIATTAFAQNVVTPNVQVLTASSGTYTPVSGMRFAIIEAVGDGGGGGGFLGSGANTGDSSGGGSGGITRALCTAATIGASQSYSIGQGGAGGLSGNHNGTAGSGTTLGTTIVVANGGSGGNGATVSGSGQTTAGGSGASAGSTTCTQLLAIPGNPGAPGISFGGNAESLGGSGGSIMYGQGGFGLINATGNAGTGYGSGGSGTGNTSSSFAGGAGAPGIIIIYEYK